MRYAEINKSQSLKIPNKIPEEDLILMFPFTYMTYRMMIAYCSDPFRGHLMTQGANGSAIREGWLGSFGAFLEEIGPAPEDVQKPH